MTAELHHDLESLGHLARTSQLIVRGHSRAGVAREVREGRLTRPVRGWVAGPQAERDAVIAVLHGGVLTDASALGSYGIWGGLDRSIHVLLSRHSRGGRAVLGAALTSYAPPPYPTFGVVRHWQREPRKLTGVQWRVSVVDALASFARTQPTEFAVAAIDSALHTGRLAPSALPELHHRLPLYLKPLLDLVDRRAESGTESIARLRFGAIARSVEIQVPVGRHRIDILLDGWLAIEIDSEEWHSSSRVDDLRKAAWLTSQGYRVEHYDYQQVMQEWMAVETAIRAILATR